MKSSLFPRPNLKVFALTALATIALHQWISFGDSNQFATVNVEAFTALNSPSSAYMEELVQQSLANPTSQMYYLISDGYRQLGVFDRSMHYLRKARLAEEVEYLME